MPRHSQNTYKQVFNSPEEYAEFCLGIPSDLLATTFSSLPIAECARFLRDGDLTRLGEARAIMDRLEVDSPMAIEMPALTPSVAGFMPNVPAMLSGHPESMFCRGTIENPNINSPISIYVETTVSAGVSKDQLIKRGVAILALVLTLETVRPVDLYIANHHSHSRKTGVYGYLVKIASRPMDLARAVWMLTDPIMARRLFHSTINELSGCGRQCGVGPWSWGLTPTSAEYIRRTREFFDMQPHDLFISGGHLSDRLMLDNPVQWVKTMVEKYQHQDEMEMQQ